MSTEILGGGKRGFVIRNYVFSCEFPCCLGASFSWPAELGRFLGLRTYLCYLLIELLFTNDRFILVFRCGCRLVKWSWSCIKSRDMLQSQNGLHSFFRKLRFSSKCWSWCSDREQPNNVITVTPILLVWVLMTVLLCCRLVLLRCARRTAHPVLLSLSPP